MSEYHAGTGDIKHLCRHETVTPPSTDDDWYIPPVGEKGSVHLFGAITAMLTFESIFDAACKWLGI